MIKKLSSYEDQFIVQINEQDLNALQCALADHIDHLKQLPDPEGLNGLAIETIKGMLDQFEKLW